MNAHQGTLFNAGNDVDPYVRFLRFRYFMIHIGYHPEIFDDLLPLTNLCLSSTENDSLYTLAMLEDELRALIDDIGNYPQFVQKRAELGQFLRGVEDWYVKHRLHRLGGWCKDIAITFLIDKHSRRHPDSPGASYHKLFITEIGTPENRLNEQPNFIDYLYQAARFQDENFEAYIPSSWSYNFKFEERSAYEDRVMEQISGHLKSYMNLTEKVAIEETKLQKITKSRASSNYTLNDRLSWLYSRHIEKIKLEEIADKYKVQASEQLVVR